MKSILLKIDDELFRETEERVKELKISRNSYIKKAMKMCNKWLKDKSIENQLRKESLMIRNESYDQDLIREFQEASLEDLQKHLDE